AAMVLLVVPLLTLEADARGGGGGRGGGRGHAAGIGGHGGGIGGHGGADADVVGGQQAAALEKYRAGLKAAPLRDRRSCFARLHAAQPLDKPGTSWHKLGNSRQKLVAGGGCKSIRVESLQLM